MTGLYDVTLPSGHQRNVVKLERIMDVPVSWMMFGCWSTSGSGLFWWSIVNLRCSLFGMVNDSTCLRVDCCHETWHSLRFILASPAVQTRARSWRVAMFIRHQFAVADFGASSPSVPPLGRPPSRGVSGFETRAFNPGTSGTSVRTSRSGSTP